MEFWFPNSGKFFAGKNNYWRSSWLGRQINADGFLFLELVSAWAFLVHHRQMQLRQFYPTADAVVAWNRNLQISLRGLDYLHSFEFSMSRSLTMVILSCVSFEIKKCYESAKARSDLAPVSIIPPNHCRLCFGFSIIEAIRSTIASYSEC